MIKPKTDTSPIDRLQHLRQTVESNFRDQFGHEPTVIAAAPGRVNLIGEHIDYNDGFVLPMAVERYVVMAAAPSNDVARTTANAISLSQHGIQQVPLRPTSPSIPGWGRYLEGVLAGFNELGAEVPAFDAVIGSDIPSGGGLSSSAALEVATATTLESLSGMPITATQKALLCQTAEHNFAGVPCGIMDQFSSVFGEPNALMLLDCRSQEIESVPFLAHDVSILITNSNVSHELADGEYGRRRMECDSALKKINLTGWREITLETLESKHELLTTTEYDRSEHVITETQRTLDAVEAFRNGDWKLAGELMYASHASLRNQYQVSCDELDLLVDAAQAIGIEGGVFGARMTGGGFGGCIVSLVSTEYADSVIESIHEQYKTATGIDANSFASRPAQGAHLLLPLGQN